MAKIILVATGEPAGIGPDICLSLPPALRKELIFLGDIKMLRQRAKDLGLEVNFRQVEDSAAKITAAEQDGAFNIIHHPTAREVIPGKPDQRNNDYLFKQLGRAVELQGELQQKSGAENPYAVPIITAPVSKQTLNLSRPFIGMTEFLADCWNDPAANSIALAEEARITRPVRESRIFCGQVMNLPPGEDAPRELRVAFVTMHLPLAQVAAKITPEVLTRRITDAERIMARHFARQSESANDAGARPRLALCGINPHAGEDGLLGGEEKELVIPLVKKLRAQGLDIAGPLSADSLFIPQNARQYDGIIAMAHDQGLAPFKALTFGRGAQLSFYTGADGRWNCLRISPDHGTAFDLAARGKANSGGMEYAVNLARRFQWSAGTA